MTKLSIEAQEQLKGMIKEQMQELPNDKLTALEQKWAEKEEQDAKILEENTELKAKMEALQGKMVEINTKTAGKVKMIYKGMDPDMSKNFKGALDVDQADAVAKAYVSSAKTGDPFEKAFDGTYAVPVEYSNTLLGLAENDSIGMQEMNVVRTEAPTIYAPVKATRSSADAQSPGTANNESAMTLGQLTFTIDKYIGEYVEVLNSELDDANFDFVNQWLIPAQAEAIGQYIDDEVFDGTNSIFTSSIIDVTAAVTASGSTDIAAAVTFDNLNTMYHHIEWERGIKDGVWFGPRGVLKDIRGLKGTTNDHPIFMETPINGRPSYMVMGSRYVITPAITNTPGNGVMRLCFGDPSKYTIALRGQVENVVNPYILMKEHKTQFIASIRADGNVSDNATAASSGAWAVMKRNDA